MSIYKKIAEFQAKFEGVEKKRENPFTKSKYANLDDVYNAAKPILNELEVVTVQPIIIKDGDQVLKTIVMDVETETSVESEINLSKMTEKGGAQGYGSAITYSRRYALCSILGIVETADDDGNAAQNNGQEKEIGRLLAHNKALRENFDTVAEVKGLLSGGHIDEAMRYMRDLDQDIQMALWMAPTKGGIFTTDERNMMQSKKVK